MEAVFYLEDEAEAANLAAMPFPSASELRKAADLTEKIEAAQAELAALLGGEGAAPVKRGRPAKKEKAKRTMSEEGRKRIAAAQKKRWAAKKAASE